MALADTDIALIRDEIGATPDDADLYEMGDELGHWLPVAIRVLKRRRADATAGGSEATTFSLAGVFSVGLSKADLRSLDSQIERLEAQWAAYNGEAVGVVVGRMVRPDRAVR